MKHNKSSGPMGRPRSFDAGRALDRALQVFWRKGYEGTSLSDLTEAVGVNRPSLYAAFGDKKALFRKALDRYVTGPGGLCPRSIEGTDRPRGR
jgi:AcrR family transcriptional regulator